MDPRGSELETCGVIGGVVFYWLKRAFKANLYYHGVKLVAAGGLMVIVGVFRRFIAIAVGKQPEEIVEIPPARVAEF